MRICYEISDVPKIADTLLKHSNTKLFLFYGSMGVGKTTLIKALIKSLGSHDDVTSPTFSIVNEYELKDDKIYHFDLYRINDLEDVYNFGIEDYLDSYHWIFIEWPEKIESILNRDYNSVELSLNNENKRVIVLKSIKHGSP